MRNTDQIRALADAARDAQATGEVAGYFGTANYAQGVEDALRYALGVAPMTDDLRHTSRQGIKETAGVAESWHVEDNVTGARASRDFPTVAIATATCREMNSAAPGGRYGVYDSTGNRAMPGGVA